MRNFYIEIRNGVQLRHVIPNDHKQCAKMLYDKACEKKEENNINEKETKLETERAINIGNILLNAMHKRRLLMHSESSSSSDENINEQKLELWSDTDDNYDDNNDNDNNYNDINKSMNKTQM
ncbi:unnamed protein product [Brugia pahangi]|uniref:DUF1524 domain-containing protein n=1 Tax=Brugia pahangi TaxID=6280 RepID=A0A0N4THG6_BRUPA|nr:unnamed protein product [Brugia pahangi]